jgi:hypothetical protein
VAISSDDDTDPTEKLNSEYNSEHDSDVDMRMEDEVYILDGVDIDGIVDMEWDGDDEDEKDEEEDDDVEEQEE